MTVKEHVDWILSKIAEDAKIDEMIRAEEEQYLRAYEESQQMEDAMLCPHCKEAELEICKADPPWTSDDHLQCPKCDSTYPEGGPRAVQHTTDESSARGGVDEASA